MHCIGRKHGAVCMLIEVRLFFTKLYPTKLFLTKSFHTKSFHTKLVPTKKNSGYFIIATVFFLLNNFLPNNFLQLVSVEALLYCYI